MALAVKGQDVIKSAGSLNGVRSSVVERFPDKKEVVGPIPSAPTSYCIRARVNFDWYDKFPGQHVIYFPEI
ncbi:MAG: hypothetical protein UX63_C0023G0002 [Microgenomates group bacterium GW2011_GWB1_46_7]|nr:MAG: hypothetical protein UX59_C0020G0002 [Microgenomates group bacterium GW2011_GWA1_46_7]KKU44754.1 MAG: hypothetical protein UX63_C0023G0002 [Microgenomates group bacterium GW2011_GWB1_46_7]